MIHFLSDLDPVSCSGPWYLAGVVVPSLFAYLANRSAKRAKTTTEEVKTTTEQVKASVGVANGESLSQLAVLNNEILRQLAETDSYTHTRNHDILNGMAKQELSLELLTKQVELLTLTIRGGSPPASQSTEDEL